MRFKMYKNFCLVFYKDMTVLKKVVIFLSQFLKIKK